MTVLTQEEEAAHGVEEFHIEVLMVSRCLYQGAVDTLINQELLISLNDGVPPPHTTSVGRAVMKPRACGSTPSSFWLQVLLFSTATPRSFLKYSVY